MEIILHTCDYHGWDMAIKMKITGCFKSECCGDKLPSANSEWPWTAHKDKIEQDQKK